MRKAPLRSPRPRRRLRRASSAAPIGTMMSDRGLWRYQKRNPERSPVPSPSHLAASVRFLRCARYASLRSNPQEASAISAFQPTAAITRRASATSTAGSFGNGDHAVRRNDCMR